MKTNHMISGEVFYPFAVGLGIGLVVALVVWIQGLGKLSSLRKDVKRLREHLNTQMEVTATGTESLRKELAELKEKNENLRVTNSTLKTKAGKEDLYTLHLYDKAVHLMYEKAPGFAPAWENALKEAEHEMKQADSGRTAFIRRLFSTSSSDETPRLTQDDDAYRRMEGDFDGGKKET